MSLKNRIAKIIQAEENEQAQQLLNEYADCTNMAGSNKISPLIIIYKKDMDQLQTMANGAQMADYIVNRIEELNKKFEDAGIGPDKYDYVRNWATKMKNTMSKKKNAMDALMYFSNAVLKGDNLGVDRAVASLQKDEMDFTAILANKDKAKFIGEMLLHFANKVK